MSVELIPQVLWLKSEWVYDSFDKYVMFTITESQVMMRKKQITNAYHQSKQEKRQEKQNMSTYRFASDRIHIYMDARWEENERLKMRRECKTQAFCFDGDDCVPRLSLASARSCSLAWYCSRSIWSWTWTSTREEHACIKGNSAYIRACMKWRKKKTWSCLPSISQITTEKR